MKPAGAAPDEFEEEFLDEVMVPDAEAARGHWEKTKSAFAGGRWCHGQNVTSTCPDEVLAILDMESRWEGRLRGRFTGTWKGEAAGL